MRELFRFSLARAPQRVAAGQNVILNPGDLLPGIADPERRSAVARNFLASFGLLAPLVRIDLFNANLPLQVRLGLVALLLVDDWLVAQNNRPPNGLPAEFAPPAELAQARNEGPTTQLSDLRPNFEALQSFLDAALIAAAISSDVTSTLRGQLTRLRLVLVLVEIALADPPHPVTADEVEDILRDSQLVLPLQSLKADPPAVLARRIGFSDMYVVREEWTRYEPGELAQVENVLAKESKKRELVQFDETTKTLVQEDESTTIDERQLQTTDRFDLSDEASREAALTLKLDGSVDTSGQYGPTHVNTHIGGSLDFSQKDAEQHAAKQSHEIVSRAATRIERHVKTTRSLQTIRRVTGTNQHAFDNAGNSNIVGVYRWVDKVKTLQIFRYPNRLLLEFHVPEPGAWLRWLAATRAAAATLATDPLPLTLTGGPFVYTPGNPVPTNLLTPAAIDGGNYLALGARYGTAGLTALPGGRSIATVITQPSDTTPNADKQPIDFYGNASISVPNGYEATKWTASIMSWQNRASFPNATGSVLISVGNSAIEAATVDANREAFEAILSGSPGPVTQGAIPVSLRTDSTRGFAINVEVACDPLAETITKWKIETFDAIVEAYTEMKRRHDSELAARAIRSTAVDGSVSPVRAQEIVQLELKRATIDLLRGGNAAGIEGYSFGANGEPSFDFASIGMAAPVVQFFEEAFEWENISYALYSHFWSARKRWPDLALIEGTDPDFARFMRSGAARVVVPARPGFEPHVMFYLSSGQVWSGGPVPAPNDPDYLSVAQEIRAKTQAPTDGIPGESWEVRLPTDQIWLQATPELPFNPKPTLPVPPPAAPPLAAVPSA